MILTHHLLPGQDDKQQAHNVGQVVTGDRQCTMMLKLVHICTILILNKGIGLIHLKGVMEIGIIQETEDHHNKTSTDSSQETDILAMETDSRMNLQEETDNKMDPLEETIIIEAIHEIISKEIRQETDDRIHETEIITIIITTMARDRDLLALIGETIINTTQEIGHQDLTQEIDTNKGKELTQETDTLGSKETQHKTNILVFCLVSTQHPIMLHGLTEAV